MDKVAINNLLDYYDVLLTDKQLDICNLYFREDLSLQEISEELNVTRASIYDTVHRCEKILCNYEDKLRLYESSKQRRYLYSKIKAYNIDEINIIIDELIKTE